MRIFVAYYEKDSTIPVNVDAADLRQPIVLNYPENVKRIEIVPATRQKHVVELYENLLKKFEKNEGKQNTVQKEVQD